MDSNVIRAKHTSIIIPNYTLGNNDKLEKMLSVWNGDYFRWETIGFDYNEERKELLLPRGLDIDYLERLFRLPVQIEHEPDPFDPAVFRLLTEPKSDIQRKSISYLLGNGDFSYTTKHSQLTLNLDTGDGKTYCVIAALTFLKMKSLIVTHNKNVKDQWYNSLLKMTDLDRRFILNIDGSSAINKLLKHKGNIPYKVFLINHRSIQSFAKKEGWGKITELFQKLKIGVKVFDEAHLEFDNLIKTDLHTNTKKTFYLTANFERSDHRENKVFDLCFKNIAKYGRETRSEKRRHIICLIVKYNSKPTLVERASIRGKHGLDKNKFSDYQLTKGIFFDVQKYVLDFIGDKEGRKLLIYTKNNAIDEMYKYFKAIYPDKDFGVYNSVVGDEEKERALNSEFILSTVKSMGTGTDIPGIRFNIVAEPYSSPVTANQLPGRLREYGEDRNTLHIELVDEGFPEVIAMLKKRMPIFKKKFVDIKELKFKGVL